MLKKGFVRSVLPYGMVSLVVALFYFISRLFNLTIIPIFTDEAIYLRWGQIALGDPRWRFISMIDGKQPLLIWLFLPAFKLIQDPLVAGRLVSVAMGLVGLAGLMIFGWYKTRSAKGPAIAAALYLCIPFFLVYDRMALYEALLSALSIWVLFLSYLLARKQRLDVAIILGTVIGAGLLTKSSANFFLILLPISFLLIDWKKENRVTTAIKWMGLMMVVFIQSQIYNNILRLSEFRHIIGQKNLSFIYSFQEFFANPLQGVYGNNVGLSRWLIGYLTIPLCILIIISFIWLIRKNWRDGVFFLSYFLVPYVALALFGKIIYPRFLLFMIPGLLIPVVMFAHEMLQSKNKRTLVIACIIVVLVPLIYFDSLLLTNPIKAPLPQAERKQFLTDWPSGYGITEVVAYLTEQAKTQKIVVGTDGTFGLFPMALELYLGKNPNVTFKPYYPLNEFPADLREDAKTMPTFMIFKERQEKEPGWPLELIAQYQRGDASSYLKFYRVVYP